MRLLVKINRSRITCNQLLRCPDKKIYGNDKESDIRNPYSQQRRHYSIHGESSGHGGKNHIQSAQPQANAQIQPHASPHFP